MSPETAEPTTADVLHKAVAAINAVQDAEKTLLGIGARLNEHQNDPEAHGGWDDSPKTPVAHAAGHKTGGSDALTPADIGAQADMGITALGGPPAAQAFGDAATAGTSTAVARADHKHPMPAAPTSVSGNAGTATKLSTARTIALSGKATGTATAFDGTANIAIPVTAVTADSCTGNAASATTAASCTGNAGTATKLATARTLQTNLASAAAASFDGSANAAPGVSGVLPIANGGTGAATAAAARNALGLGNTAGALPIANGGTGAATAAAALTALGAAASARKINTTAPLTGGGDLSADRTLAVSAATQSAAGVIELATAAEVLAGYDAVRAVTPATLLAAFTPYDPSLYGGYQRLPSGLILQWGWFNCAKTNTYYYANFGVAFPSECKNLVVSVANTDSLSTLLVPYWYVNSNTRFKVCVASTGAALTGNFEIYWQAIGI